jgi:hypothetical protein
MATDWHQLLSWALDVTLPTDFPHDTANTSSTNHANILEFITVAIYRCNIAAASCRDSMLPHKMPHMQHKTLAASAPAAPLEVP